MYSIERLHTMTTEELEALSRVLYNHTPRVKKRHLEWETDLQNIRNEINKKEVSK